MLLTVFDTLGIDWLGLGTNVHILVHWSRGYTVYCICFRLHRSWNKFTIFFKKHWDIAKWVALGEVILEARVFLLALIIVRAANRPANYDSDDKFIDARQGVRQPLIRPAPPATGVPVTGALDQRPRKNDAWSTRMREKIWIHLISVRCGRRCSSRRLRRLESELRFDFRS
ncbi:hypothetical protein QQ045_006254 [Rhodiola kirilowii]